MGLACFVSASFDPFLNLATEEALLASAAAPEACLFLYRNDPCLVIGRNQNPWAEVAPGAGLPLLRRVSGGGAVYHDRGNLNWALIQPRGRHDPDAEVALVAAALKAGLGVEAESGPRGGLFLRAPEALAGAKISGTARRFAAAKVLHHGTLLVAADLDALRANLGGLPIALDRGIASVPGRPVNLREFVPGLEPERAAAVLAAGLGDGSPPRDAAAFLAAHPAAAALADASRARLSGWAWTYGATPDFSFLVSDSPELRLVVRGGKVVELEGEGGAAARRLLGRPFDAVARELAALGAPALPPPAAKS